MNDNNEKKKNFIHRPEYPGGKKALLQYIKDNLNYPKDALEQKIEGPVRLWYEVNDHGIVDDAKVTIPLYPSCDEEALRLVRSLKYSRPKNRNLRVKASFTITIHFRLKDAAEKVTLQYTQTAPPKKKEQHTETYTYTINF
ncbi:MAG: energy transducer TonB [Bacteroidales bacterium]|nr:energy transducer TonB [Bacteroidales bacterium]